MVCKTIRVTKTAYALKWLRAYAVMVLGVWTCSPRKVYLGKLNFINGLFNIYSYLSARAGRVAKMNFKFEKNLRCIRATSLLLP